MEKSSFFNSVSGDRKYNAEDWASYFASLIGNGVFPIPSTGLQVVAGNGMQVTVKAGKAWINGYFYNNTSDLSLTLATADGVLNRIDRIVVRWDLTKRKISVVMKSSTPATSPVVPALQRDADAYELCIADVFVRAGSTSVMQLDITDQRYNSSLCGIVTGMVEQIDASTLAKQFNDYADLFKQETKQEFENWFDEIQGILSGDIAGSLALAIDDINQSKAQPNGIATLDGSGKLAQMPTAADVGAIKLAWSTLINEETETPNKYDFDDYIAPGNVVSVCNYAGARSIANIPEQVPGKLYVLPLRVEEPGRDDIMQEYHTVTGHVWCRPRYYYGTNDWSDWAGGPPKSIIIPDVSGATTTGSIGWAYKNSFGEINLGIWADLSSPVNSINFRAIGTLPEGYRPSPYESLQTVVQLRGSTSGLEAGFLSIGSDGKVGVARAVGSSDVLDMVRGQVSFYAAP